ncbi:MAG: hypothetical protein WC905_00030 [Patescibacteria group bacterium]|jgi:hypothetical protein
MKTAQYQIKPLVWLVKDEASVKFHVASDDYFGTIATILSLARQQMKNGRSKNRTALEKTWKNLEKDLLFLQKNYQISPRIKNKKIVPNGRLKSQ